MLSVPLFYLKILLLTIAKKKKKKPAFFHVHYLQI